MAATDVRTDDPYMSSAIICGTARMGDDPKRSVVSAELRAHDHPNLFVVGTSAHVTAPVNAPTLTVAANSLRVAALIQKDLAGK
jgi:choline dehydrogenase-like flavoprotein